MSSDQDRDHPVMWDWTDEGGGNYHVAVASSPHWAYPNDDTDFPNDCDCSDLPPPPKFALPPPPVPFGSGGDDCHSSDVGGRRTESNETPNPRLLADLEYCDMRVLEGPYTQTAIPSLILIVGCSFVMIVMVLVAILLFRKHKRKMQNFLPCKASPGNHCDLASGNSVLYEDLTNIRPRNLTNQCTPNQTVAPMEHPEDNTLLDVKCSNYGGAGFTSVGNTTFIYQPTMAAENIVLKNCKSKDHFNQAYEEVSAGSSDGKRVARDSDFGSEVDDDDDDEAVAVDATGRNVQSRSRVQRSSVSSEGELAEDELSLVDFPKKAYTEEGRSHHGSCSGDSSLRGSTGDDLCRDFDSVYSEDNETTTKSTAGSRDTFQGPSPAEEIFPYDGPSSSSGERKRRRKRGQRDGRGGGAPPRRVDHYRQNAYPLYSEIHDVNGDDRVVPLSLHQGGGIVDQVPRYGRNVNGSAPAPQWRTSNLDNGDVYDGYRNGVDSGNPEMVLMIPATQRRDLPRPPSGLGGGDLGLKSQVGGYRNNLVGDDLQHHRVPSSGQYSTQQQQQQQQQQQPLWGPDYPLPANQRNSDPHERSLAEFSTFQPKRSCSVPVRDLYGLDAGLLNNDVGGVGGSTGPYAHLPTGQRNSGSEDSRSSTSSAERLLPVNDGSSYPYQHPAKPFRQHPNNHHHHQHHHSPVPVPLHPSSSSSTTNRQHQPHFLPETLPRSPAGISVPHRVAFPSNQRSNNRRKSGNKSTAAAAAYADADLDAPYGARTVFT